MSVGKGLASRLRERVTIQEPNVVDNGRGGRRAPDGQPRWRDVATDVPAEIVALRGGEALTLGVERNSQLYRVTIRLRTGLNTDKRLVWRGVPLDIKAMPLSTDRATIVMTCESRSGAS